MMMMMITMLAPTLTTGQMQRTQCIGGSVKVEPNTGRIPPHRLAVAFVLPSLKSINDMCYDDDDDDVMIMMMNQASEPHNHNQASDPPPSPRLFLR